MRATVEKMSNLENDGLSNQNCEIFKVGSSYRLADGGNQHVAACSDCDVLASFAFRHGAASVRLAFDLSQE